jgi:branched-subunit amino acid ABC-type transport system permease component
VTALVQLLISGVLLGGIYALAAFGLALIFGVCNILNLAHGEFLMLGALVCFLLGQSLGIEPFAATLVLLPLFFVLGMLFERGLIRTVMEKTGHEQLTAAVLVTLGLSLCIEDVARVLWVNLCMLSSPWMPRRSGRILSLLMNLIWSIASPTTAQGNPQETSGIRALSSLWWPQAAWQDNLQC